MAPRKTAHNPALGLMLEHLHSPTRLVGPVDEYLLRSEAAKPRFLPLGFHPSQLSGDTCARALVLERLGVAQPEAPPPKLQRIFGMGSDVHTRWQRHLVAAGTLKPWQVEVPLHQTRRELDYRFLKHLHAADGVTPDDLVEVPDAWQRRTEVALKNAQEYGLRGSADALLDDSDLTVVEIKSMNWSSFQRYPLVGKPMPKHLLQASLYAWAFRSKAIVFLIECKDNQQAKEVEAAPDKGGVQAVLELCALAQETLQDQRLPDRHSGCPTRTSAKAKACPFAAACFSNKKFSQLDQRKHLPPPRDYR